MTSCICPTCGFSGDLVVFTNDVQARYFAALMGKLPPELAEAVTRYLNLFSPAKHKLTWPRARRLLEELVPDIQRGAIERKRRQWLAPMPVWIRAFEHMHEQRPNLTLPLKSHGYLYEVIVGLVDKAEDAAERTAEQKLRVDSRAPQQEQTGPDAAREAQVRNLVQVINSRLQEDRRKKLPATSLDGYANSYRDQFGDLVVDAALNRLQTLIQQEQP